MRTRLLPPVLLLLVTSGPAWADPPATKTVIGRIDAHLTNAWAKKKVQPAAVADDAVFLRRVTLDLVGRIPTAGETRTFLADTGADKRVHLVDQLLNSSAHARHMATFWRRVWIPQADTVRFLGFGDDFEPWLAGQFRDGTPYDKIARDLLTVPRGGAAKTPATFLIASEFQPENLAANTTRAFLGINLECAECHDHPFSRWTRDQFWETAAFFAGSSNPRFPKKKTTPDTMQVRFELTIPNTNKTVSAKLISGESVPWPEQLQADSGRQLLAQWVTGPKNPYFAQNAVNRLWENFLGRGLVEPLDDLSGAVPASHPEVLQELTNAFIDSGFDLKVVTKIIVLSRAYQLSSVMSPAEKNSNEPELFAHMPVRGLTGEQLYESIRVAAGLPPDRWDLEPVNALKQRQSFAKQFYVERPGKAQRSILQALAMMNGKATAEMTRVETPFLVAVGGSPFLDKRGQVETLFLATLGRVPTTEEAAPFLRHLDQPGTSLDQQRFLADVFWVLLNSSEFNTNH